MNPISPLIAFALRQKFDDAEGDIYQLAGDLVGGSAKSVFSALRRYYKDHTRTWPLALARASNRTWDALDAALANTGAIWQLLSRGDYRNPRRLVQRVLDEPNARFPADFRSLCREELKDARDQGLLSPAPVEELSFVRRVIDPRFSGTVFRGLIEGACEDILQVAESLRRSHQNLVALLTYRLGNGCPLLAEVFTSFLEREVKNNEELSRGFQFQLIQTQEALLALLLAQGRGSAGSPSIVGQTPAAPPSPPAPAVPLSVRSQPFLPATAGAPRVSWDVIPSRSSNEVSVILKQLSELREPIGLLLVGKRNCRPDGPEDGIVFHRLELTPDHDSPVETVLSSAEGLIRYRMFIDPPGKLKDPPLDRM